MERVKLTDNLFLDEYIPKELYLKTSPSILISLLDSRMIACDQKLRDAFGSVTINNWWTGGNRNWSGLRTPDCPNYSPTSQHSFGRASDKIFSAPADEVRQYIKNNWRELGITRIEDNVSWVHSDVAYTIENELIIF